MDSRLRMTKEARFSKKKEADCSQFSAYIFFIVEVKYETVINI